MPRRYVHFYFWGNITCCELQWDEATELNFRFLFLIFSLLPWLVEFYYFPLLFFLLLPHPISICPQSFLPVFVRSRRSNLNFRFIIIPFWTFLFSVGALVDSSDPRNNKTSSTPWKLKRRVGEKNENIVILNVHNWAVRWKAKANFKHLISEGMEFEPRRLLLLHKSAAAYRRGNHSL